MATRTICSECGNERCAHGFCPRCDAGTCEDCAQEQLASGRDDEELGGQA